MSELNTSYKTYLSTASYLEKRPSLSSSSSSSVIHRDASKAKSKISQQKVSYVTASSAKLDFGVEYLLKLNDTIKKDS